MKPLRGGNILPLMDTLLTKRDLFLKLDLCCAEETNLKLGQSSSLSVCEEEMEFPDATPNFTSKGLSAHFPESLVWR